MIQEETPDTQTYLEQISRFENGKDDGLKYARVDIFGVNQKEMQA